MAPSKQELSLLLNPLVPEAVQHNNKTLTNLHSVTSFLLGLVAGILALQSAYGFAFYLSGTVLVSGVFHLLLISRSGGGAGVFFPGANGEIADIDERGFVHNSSRAVQRKGAWRDVWFGGGVMGEALSGFVLGWAGTAGVLH
ncbi:hypothetical protein ASPZODRAFT_15275 [Penicilliopsis zonata CBS 506.65]|uniref:ER membrane protein complex subunit 6 n=1 Tax=Penicilliopsis zonata CBS 506.65 TaxID=1073090 RepID=A0A1L9SL28_9EURO|nr:hypothetical protein ASPZODRAFT_15275 [Penicilliopsis zonata CBS 506.65]OJJ47826.1 hypothetical protein ASPZODRAFT_15275 [Penicilliopsis zonata CBS 506.65]